MIGIILYWTAYFALHSLLASSRTKEWVRSIRPEFPYRLAYNAAALVLLFPGLWLLWGKSWPVLWEFGGTWKYLAWSARILAIYGFLASLRYYDMNEFLGFGPEKTGSFTISPFHRYVRHPWYCFALVLLWSSNMNSGRLAFSLLATGYLFLGSRHEEKMLIARFGERYEAYRRKVPALFPSPWKYLSENEAKTLVK